MRLARVVAQKKKAGAAPGLMAARWPSRQAAWMLLACLPFGPVVTSNDTFWPSLRVARMQHDRRKPAPDVPFRQKLRYSPRRVLFQVVKHRSGTTAKLSILSAALPCRTFLEIETSSGQRPVYISYLRNTRTWQLEP
jgi:hypothetical protein